MKRTRTLATTSRILWIAVSLLWLVGLVIAYQLGAASQPLAGKMMSASFSATSQRGDLRGSHRPEVARQPRRPRIVDLKQHVGVLSRFLDVDLQAGLLSPELLEFRLNLAKLSPAELLELSEEIQVCSGDGQPALLRMVFQQLALLDPTMAMDKLGGLPPASREAALTGIFESWAANDPAAARIGLDSLSGEARETARSVAFAEFARLDPGGTLKEVMASGHVGLIHRVFQDWLRRDSAAAIAALEADTSTGYARNILIELGTGQLATTDPSTAIEWINRLPAGDRATAEQAFLLALSAQQPTAAGEAMLNWLPGRQLDSPVWPVDEITRAMAAESSEKTRDWIAKLPPGEVRDVALRELAEAWSETDLPAAAAWIATLADSPSRNAATVRMVERVSPLDPESALEWSRSVTDPEARFSALRTVFDDWFRINPERAYQEMQALPEADREIVSAARASLPSSPIPE